MAIFNSFLYVYQMVSWGFSGHFKVNWVLKHDVLVEKIGNISNMGI